jgi:hypothetical protein
MDEPGTKITGEETTTRTLGGVEIEQTIIRWNATARISVDYHVGNVDIYADPHQLTSFDEPLTDSQLIELLATYGVRSGRLTVARLHALVHETLAGLCRRSRIALDAVFDDDAAASPATDQVRDRGALRR